MAYGIFPDQGSNPCLLHWQADSLPQGSPSCPFLTCGRFFSKMNKVGLPWWLSDKEPACQSRRHGFKPRFGKIPHATEQVSPFTTTPEPVLQSPGATAREATTRRSLHTATRATREYPFLPLEKARVQQQRPSTAKTKQTNK